MTLAKMKADAEKYVPPIETDKQVYQAGSKMQVQLHPRATTVREAISVLSRRPPAPDRA